MVVNQYVSAPGLSGSATTFGWSAGFGAGVDVLPGVNLGAQVRWWGVPTNSISVFPGSASSVSEHGTMVSGTLTFKLPGAYFARRDFLP
jgi:hypothetical protein